MWERLKVLWVKYTPFDLTSQVNVILHRFDSVDERLHLLNNLFDLQLNSLIAEIEYRTSLLDSIGDTIPDMLWAKDLDGRYLYANKATCDDLLCTPNPIGLTDVEMSLSNKKRQGEENFTFGQLCADSDAEVLITHVPTKFIEKGKVHGKLIYLEVYKNVIKSKSGIVIGTCGSGRDVTEIAEAYKKNACMRDICAAYDFDILDD